MGELPARDPRSTPGTGVEPLAGYAVAVAADTRKHPLGALLEGLGARVIGVQAIRSTPQPDEAPLRAATEEVLGRPCDELVISSAGGLRSWLGAAGGWGVADALLARFANARLLARDARVADAMREFGLSAIWSTPGGTTEELFRYLAAQDLAGRRVVAQLDRVSLREPVGMLHAAGAEVVEVPTFRVYPPTYAAILRRLTDQIVKRQVDAVALLGEPATLNLLTQAAEYGRSVELLNSLCEDVPCACLGELTAAPLRAQGVSPLVGAGPYVEELAEELANAVPRLALRLDLNGYRVEVRGQAVVIDGRFVPVQAGPIAVLRALAREPGRVLSCAEIRRVVPDGSTVDDHAIEMAVLRLRRCLAGADLIQTVMKRGYRLVGY